MFRFFIFIFSVFTFQSFLYGQELPDTVKLPEVVIIGKFNYNLPFITSTVDKLTLQTTNTHDIGEYLRQVPNVSGIRKGGNAIDPVVRGFKYSQLNVMISNGIKIENGCPNRMDPVSSHIEAEDVENIEIIKGPFALKYGPNFGGVINLEAKDPKPYDQFQLHANALYGFESNWNGHKTHFSIDAGNRAVFFQVSGGYRNYGNYRSGKRDENDTIYSSAFKKYNYSARLGYAFRTDQQVMLSYDIIRSRNVMYPALSMDEKSDDTGIISFDYKAKNLGARIKTLDIKIYRSKVHHVMDNHKRPSSLLMLMVADVNAANTGGRTEININYGKHRITCGMDYENIGKDGTRTGTMEMMGTISKNITNLWKQACIQNTGLFMQYSVPVSSFEIMAGIRGDLNYATSGDTLKLIRDGENYFDDVNSRFLNLSISAGVTEMFNSYTTLSLAAGRGTRSPNMLERYIKLLPVGYDNYDYLGNPVLDPEINNEIDITLKYNRKNTGGFQFNIFYSCVQGYISTQLLPPSVIKPQTQGVLGVKQFVNTNYVTFKGFEFNYKSPVGYKLGGNLVAAFTYGTIPSVYQYVISGSEITDRKLIKNDALPEIPPLEATVTVHYKLLQDRLVPKISIRKVAGQHHISKAYYEPSTRGFTLMHFSAEFTLNKNIRLLAGVNNIFNRAYYEHLNRKIIGTTGKLYEPGRVFFVNLNAEI